MQAKHGRHGTPAARLPPRKTFLTPLASTRLAVLVAAALAAGFAAAPAQAAPAACVSATPQVVSLVDAADDAEAGAPEVTTVNAQVKADCTVSVRLGIANRTRLLPDDAVLVYLNTDGNTATGAKSFGGADQGVGLVADEDGPGYIALLGRWDPSAEAIDFENATELDISTTGGFGFTAGIDELGVASGSSLGISIAALSEPDGEIALDFAPDDEGGTLNLPIAFSTTATRQTDGTTTTPTQTPTRDGIVRRTCRVPKLKGRSLAGARKALKAAGCRTGRTRGRYGTDLRKGRVVTTLPAAGLRIAATRPVTIVVAR